MLTSRRGTVRHAQFSENLERLAEKYSEAYRIVDGAIWEIERNPESIGVLIREIDIWQARLVYPPVFLFYCFNQRYVTMLTIKSTDESVNS